MPSALGVWEGARSRPIRSYSATCTALTSSGARGSTPSFRTGLCFYRPGAALYRSARGLSAHPRGEGSGTRPGTRPPRSGLGVFQAPAPGPTRTPPLPTSSGRLRLYLAPPPSRTPPHPPRTHTDATPPSGLRVNRGRLLVGVLGGLLGLVLGGLLLSWTVTVRTPGVVRRPGLEPRRLLPTGVDKVLAIPLLQRRDERDGSRGFRSKDKSPILSPTHHVPPTKKGIPTGKESSQYHLLRSPRWSRRLEEFGYFFSFASLMVSGSLLLSLGLRYHPSPVTPSLPLRYRIRS